MKPPDWRGSASVTGHRPLETEGVGWSINKPAPEESVATHLPLVAPPAPDMPPVWRQGQRNLPDQLLPIAESLAALRFLPLASVLESTTANARKIMTNC